MSEVVPEVWVVSNFPPPVHGVSAFNQEIVKAMHERNLSVRVFPVGTRGSLAGVQRVSPTKAVEGVGDMIRFVGAALTARHSRDRAILYFTPSQGGAAVFRDEVVSAIGRRRFRRTVAHVHGCAWINVWKKGGRVAETMARVLANCDVVICLGKTYAREMRIVTGANCVGIDNGVAMPLATGPKNPPKECERIELVYLSNLMRAKGVWTAAFALRNLVRRGLQARLRYAGAWRDALEEAEFSYLFEDEIRAGSIEVMGFVSGESKVRLLDTAHFLLLPTMLLEGQPLSLVEGMARGVVPITTNQGGIGDILDFANSSRLSSSEYADPDSIADAVAALVSNAEQYCAASQSCLRRVQNGLTADACNRRVIDAIVS